VQVEQRTNHLGLEVPVRFRFDGREVEIVEIVDQWYGPDYCYFKIKGNDGNLYILRFDESRVAWELTMFQSPGVASPILSELNALTENWILASQGSGVPGSARRVADSRRKLRPDISPRRSRPCSKPRMDH
jgi:hypothetical protein